MLFKFWCFTYNMYLCNAKKRNLLSKQKQNDLIQLIKRWMLACFLKEEQNRLNKKIKIRLNNTIMDASSDKKQHN